MLMKIKLAGSASESYCKGANDFGQASGGCNLSVEKGLERRDDGFKFAPRDVTAMVSRPK